MDETDNPGADDLDLSLPGEAGAEELTADAPGLDMGDIENLSGDAGVLPELNVEQDVTMDLGSGADAMDLSGGGLDGLSGGVDASLKSGSGQPVLAMSKIQNLRVKVQAVLGTVPLKISELANIEKGDLLELDTKIGDPISIYANGDLIAKAEIVVTPDEPPRFGLTITEVVSGEVNAG